MWRWESFSSRWMQWILLVRSKLHLLRILELQHSLCSFMWRRHSSSRWRVWWWKHSWFRWVFLLVRNWGRIYLFNDKFANSVMLFLSKCFHIINFKQKSNQTRIFWINGINYLQFKLDKHKNLQHWRPFNNF